MFRDRIPNRPNLSKSALWNVVSDNQSQFLLKEPITYLPSSLQLIEFENKTDFHYEILSGFLSEIWLHEFAKNSILKKFFDISSVQISIGHQPPRSHILTEKNLKKFTTTNYVDITHTRH